MTGNKTPKLYLIESELFMNPVDITREMKALASQENHDEREHDLLQAAADYILYLRDQIKNQDNL